MAHLIRPELPVHTFPKIFDKSRLKEDEFEKYIYEIPFKAKGGRTRISKGMTAAGNIRAIHPFLKSIKSELIHYGTVGDRKVMCCVVKVTVTIRITESNDPADLISVEAFADGDLTGVPSADTLVRTVETRALNRALERLLDISKADLNSTDSDPDEEEYGTPIHRIDSEQSSRLSEMFKAQAYKKESDRKRIAEEEGEDDIKTSEGGLSDNETDHDPSGESGGKTESDDW